jgi:hypothetical protein
VLAGVVAALVIICGFHTVRAAALRLGHAAFTPQFEPTVLAAPRHTLYVLLLVPAVAVTFNLCALFFLYLFQAVGKRTWVSRALLFVTLMAPTLASGLDLPFAAAAGALLASIWLTVLVRFGLLSASVLMSTLLILQSTPLTLDWSAWYAGRSYAVLLFFVALLAGAAYTSLGIEVLCGNDDAMAVRALSDHWLQHLFRVGWTQVRSLQSDARRFLDKGWPAGRMERLLFLDSPLPEILDGLLRRHPLWYAGDEEPPPLREFRTLREVQLAQKALRMASLLGRYLLSVISFQLKDLREASSRLDVENLKGSTVFLTALVNSSLGRDFRFASIDRKAARKGLAQVWEVDRPPRRVRPGLADSAVEWCRAMVPATAEEELLLRDFVADAFRLLEEEFGHLAADETPDPRFTKGLWIE